MKDKLVAGASSTSPNCGLASGHTVRSTDGQLVFEAALRCYLDNFSDCVDVVAEIKATAWHNMRSGAENCYRQIADLSTRTRGMNEQRSTCILWMAKAPTNTS